MSQKSNNFKIGIFVIGFFALFGGILIVLGAGEFMKPKVYLETYFDESVTGVTVGSPLRFRGVSIGSVSDIQFAANRYPEKVTDIGRRNYVVVILEVQTEIFGDLKEAKVRETLKELAPRGWRVRINKSGLTGSAHLEIDRLDKPPKTLPIDWEPELPYLPSAPAVLSELLDSVQQILAKIESLDLEASNERLQQLLAEATAGVKEMRNLEVNPLLKEVEGAAKEIRLAATDFRGAVRALDTKINEAEVAEISTEFRTALRELQGTNQRLGETIEQINYLSRSAVKPEEIQAILNSIRQVTTEINSLSEELSQNPGAVLSEPPAPARIHR
jgi:ABC-type transporter Mla subunit MlaD